METVKERIKKEGTKIRVKVCSEFHVVETPNIRKSILVNLSDFLSDSSLQSLILTTACLCVLGCFHWLLFCALWCSTRMIGSVYFPFGIIVGILEILQMHLLHFRNFSAYLANQEYTALCSAVLGEEVICWSSHKQFQSYLIVSLNGIYNPR